MISTPLVVARLRPFDPLALNDLTVEFQTQMRGLTGSPELHFAFFFHETRPGALDRLLLNQASGGGERRHDLWKTTCLEVFVGSRLRDDYLELNLSLSGDWNVYHFDQTRTGMREAADATLRLTQVRAEQAGDLRGLRFDAVLGSLPGADSKKSPDTYSCTYSCLTAPDLVMSATTVLQYQNLEIGYWAVAHTADKPDFHRRESFVLSFSIEGTP